MIFPSLNPANFFFNSIQNISTNVASTFTRTCRLFSIIVVASSKLVTGATLHEVLSKFSLDLPIPASQAKSLRIASEAAVPGVADYNDRKPLQEWCDVYSIIDHSTE